MAPAAVIKSGLRLPPATDLLVGHEATLSQGLRVPARVFLSRDVVVRGGILAEGDVVAGARCRIEGPIRSGGDIVLQDAVLVTAGVQAQGSIKILGARVAGTVRAGGDIEARGDARTYELHAGGRIRTQSAPEATDV